MTTMTAVKMLTYANRRLVPGEDFEAKSPRDLKVLLATRKARIKRQSGEIPAPPAAVAAKIDAVVVSPDQELAQARVDYEIKFGKRPFYGWDATTLRDKINAATVE